MWWGLDRGAFSWLRSVEMFRSTPLCGSGSNSVASIFIPAFLAGILNEFEGLIRGLDEQLETQSGPWVCGDDFSLADCVWGVSLLRMHWAGRAYLWSDLPRVKDYAHRCYAIPSVMEATINWPSPAPPSPHTGDIPQIAAA